MTDTASLFEPLLSFFTDDPTLRIAQTLLLGSAALLIFFVFFTLRDILLRTHSLLYQIACILLVAAVPVFGFLVYLLIRPARTVKERETEKMLLTLTGKHPEKSEPKKKEEKQQDAPAA